MCNVAALRRYMIPITRRELLDAPVYGGTPWDLESGEKSITFIRRRSRTPEAAHGTEGSHDIQFPGGVG